LGSSLKRLAILGSTGSIGRQSLEVVSSLPGRFEVVALAAGANVELLAEQVRQHRPKLVAAGTEAAAKELRERLQGRSAGGSAIGSAGRQVDPLPEIVFGAEGIERAATHPDAEMVVSAAVGVVGLRATYEAVKLGRAIALANKEVLVAAGELVMAAARERGVELLPVDSEHNAIHQCLRAGAVREIKRLVLTASGGPFRRLPAKRLASVTPEEALAHPNWKMGRRITIDSATLMNKGFEVIEAHWLFGLPLEQIDVVIHPQSTIHSMVEFVDGSVVAQLGPADMRIPIQYALTYPERLTSNGWRMDWAALRRLDLQPVPARKFPCLGWAREALRRGGAAPAALNAADEVAVEAFLEGRMPFTGITRVVERVVKRASKARLSSIEDVLAADAEARRIAGEEIARRSG
jgi:1-deoxy-D-xylulose-5-phosphate reductoisomerase